MNLRTRISLASVGVLSALALVLPSASLARMTPPPVKIPVPSHEDPAPNPMTRDWLLAHGGHCPFAGGMCTDSHGDIWDCSDEKNCVRPG